MLKQHNFCFVVATSILTSSNRARSNANMSNLGNFVGYSATGIPLYSFAEDKIHQTSSELLPILKNGMKHILEDDNSRSIFYFLILNLVRIQHHVYISMNLNCCNFIGCNDADVNN